MSKLSGVPLPVLLAIGQNESGFNANAQSPTGAYGFMQLEPATAKGLGVNERDPVQNIVGGAIYLRDLYKRFGRWDYVAASYNAGPGAVESHGGIPPYAETRSYVQNVLATMHSLGM